MDSITHIAVGAVIGHAAAGSIPRKKAMLLGAAAQSLPDIDFLAGLWLNPASNLLAHRGFTHSLVFAIVVSFLLAWSLHRWRRKPEVSLRYWFFFFILQLIVHLFIDVMNVYGVGLLEPFAHTRFSLNVLFVADPFFSIGPAVACIALLFAARRNRIRAWSVVGTGLPTVYLLAVWLIKLSILESCHEEFQKQGIVPSRYFATPTPLNALLWYVVAEKEHGYMIGYRSIFDNGPMRFTFFPRNDRLLDAVRSHEDLRHLQRFSQGYYVLSKENEKVVFSDIRFGQVFGWMDPSAEFAFRYYPEQPDTNILVVQRGRFSKISRENVIGTFRRIAGN